MPTPQPNESRDDFVSRCVPIVLDDGTAEDQDQAVAVCNSMWEEASKEKVNMEKQMERKTFHGFVTKADEALGVVEAYFAVFGNIDQGNDIIHPGAFTKTFLERGGKVRVLDNHRTDTLERAIGKPLLLKEVGRDELPANLLAEHPEATGGAFARVQMLMDARAGKEAFVRLRDGVIDEWSFGYDPLDFDFSRAMKDGEEVNVRNLRSLRLWEVSPVLFGMNSATTTVSAKAEADDDDKGVSGATNLPLADRDRAWDAMAARGRVRSHTGSEDAPGKAYRNAFFWFDGDEPDNFGSYKLPFVDVIGGKLTAIPRGIFAVAQRLEGTDIPGSDKAGVRSRVSSYYAKMRAKFDDDSIVPPWDKGHYVICPKEGHLTITEIDELKMLWAEMWKTDRDVLFVSIPIEITKLDEEAPLVVVEEVALDNQNDKQAGPDTPPTSNVLDEIQVLKLQTETLEVSYEEQGVART